MADTRERRKFKRFDAEIPSEVISLVYEEYSYTLYKPYSVKIIDVSQSGARISAPGNTFILGCQFEIRFKMGKKDKELLAEVMNEAADGDAGTRYGCRFYSKRKPAQKVAL